MSGSASSWRPSVSAQIETLGEQSAPTIPKDLAGKQARQLWQQAVKTSVAFFHALTSGSRKTACEDAI